MNSERIDIAIMQTSDHEYWVRCVFYINGRRMSTAGRKVTTLPKELDRGHADGLRRAVIAEMESWLF